MHFACKSQNPSKIDICHNFKALLSIIVQIVYLGRRNFHKYRVIFERRAQTQCQFILTVIGIYFFNQFSPNHHMIINLVLMCKVKTLGIAGTVGISILRKLPAHGEFAATVFCEKSGRIFRVRAVIVGIKAGAKAKIAF